MRYKATLTPCEIMAVNDWLGLVLAIAILMLFKGEGTITVLLLVLIIAMFYMQYERREGYYFIGAGILGTFLEILSDQLFQQRFWLDGSLFGVPLWLPLFWGFIAIYCRRIGNLVVYYREPKSKIEAHYRKSPGPREEQIEPNE